MPVPIDPGPYDIASTYLHLRDGGGGEPIAAGATFWDDLSAGKLPRLEHGRLMGQFAFDADWPVWERHPEGDELVMLLSGSLDFVLEQQGAERVVPLRAPGAFVLVPAGTWHTARARAASSILFVTPGRGTEHRPVRGAD
jgi:mannose-6-phosphate isomerase-like protein (cupin superfamily)